MNESIVLRRVQDKYNRFLDYDILENTGFLNLKEQNEIIGFLRSKSKEPIFLTGGYEDNERKMLIFIPEYLGVKDKVSLYDFLADEELSPIKVLKVKPNSYEKSKKLSHRDYLGAILGEGIKREKIGDILAGEDCCHVIVESDILEFLKGNLFKVGQLSVDCEEVSIKEILNRVENKEEIRVSVSSTRLDNMVSKAFNISRGKATEAINRGIVFLNDLEVTKVDMLLKGGEKIVLRGKGKVIYKGQAGTSKKGKIVVVFDKYI